MIKKDALRYVGGLSDPSKMPCFGYSLPAADCIVGSRLRKIEGSVCHGCYAHKGNYTRFPAIQVALRKRARAINKKFWVENMVYLIDHQPYPFFRWHDSGDLQSEKHFSDILDVCGATPTIKHWLPTREYDIVENVLSIRTKPKNIAVRLSAHMVDEGGPIVLDKRIGVQMSEVRRKDYTCPAHEQNNECQDCRKCWDQRIPTISYKLH